MLRTSFEVYLEVATAKVENTKHKLTIQGDQAVLN